jgi:hypothetical protein
MVIDEIEFPIDPGQKSEHRSYAISAILSSVAFLEASLNELLASVSDDYLRLGGGRGPLTSNERQLLYDIRDGLGPPFLDKFQRVLRLLGRQQFDRSAQPYQDTETVVRLRNMLVHAIPAMIPLGSTIQVAEDEVLKSLASKNFPSHPFAHTNDPFFPDKCLGAACANWAERTVREFANDFFRRLGITPDYTLQSYRRRHANESESTVAAPDETAGKVTEKSKGDTTGARTAASTAASDHETADERTYGDEDKTTSGTGAP